MVFRHQIDGGHAAERRDSEKLRETAELPRGPSRTDAEAAEQNRPLRLSELSYDLRHSRIADRGNLLIRILRRIIAFQRSRINLRRLHVKRHIQPDRPSAAAHHQIKRPLGAVPDVLRTRNHDRVLRHRLRAPGDVEFLDPHGPERKSRAAHGRLVACLAGDDQLRDRLHVGAEHAGHRVGRARTGGHQHAGRPHLRSRVGLRRHRGRLLIVMIGAAHPRTVSEGIVQMHRPAAGHEENVPDPRLRGLLNQIIRYFHLRLTDSQGSAARIPSSCRTAEPESRQRTRPRSPRRPPDTSGRRPRPPAPSPSRRFPR